MPAAAMTYDSLVEDLKFYTERGNATDTMVVTEIPRIINNTERALADKLKIQGYRYVLTSTMTSQSPVVTKPNGWRNTVSMNVGTGSGYNTRKTLRTRSYEALRAYYPNDTQFGVPAFYSDYDYNHWIVAPVPDVAYPFEAIVYRLPDLLSSSNQQNYLTQFVPFLLLYECLLAMEPFLKNDERMTTWKTLRDEQLASINGEELLKTVDRALVRQGA